MILQRQKKQLTIYNNAYNFMRFTSIDEDATKLVKETEMIKTLNKKLIDQMNEKRTLSMKNNMNN